MILTCLARSHLMFCWTKACTVTRSRSDSEMNCSVCPIKWPTRLSTRRLESVSDRLPSKARFAVFRSFFTRPFLCLPTKHPLHHFTSLACSCLASGLAGPPGRSLQQRFLHSVKHILEEKKEGGGIGSLKMNNHLSFSQLKLWLTGKLPETLQMLSQSFASLLSKKKHLSPIC